MRVLTAALLVLLVAAPATAQVTAPATAVPFSRDWKRIRSDNFTAVGNTSEAQLRAALVELERFRTALAAALPGLRFGASVPTVLVLFKDPVSMRPFNPRDDRGRPRANVAGYFFRRPDVNRMVSAVQRDRRDTFGIIFHEYAHYVINQAGRPIPLWVNEGLAEFYSTFRTTGPTAGLLGAAPRWRLQNLRRGGPLLSFDELFTAEGTSRTFRNAVQLDRFYAQSWALVHYTMVGRRAGQLRTYLRALDAGLAPADAFDRAFDVSYADLIGEMRGYVRQTRLPAIEVTFPEPVTANTNPVERLTEIEALQLQAHLHLQQNAPDDAEPLLRRALRLDSAHVGTRLALADLQRTRGRWDEAATTMRALAADAPGEFAVQYWLANDLTTRGDRDDALQAATSAVTINDRSPEAWMQLSVAAHALGRTSQSAAAMTRARNLLQNPGWYRARARRFWWLGDNAAVVRDVAAYIDDVGWGNEGVPYAAFLSALAHRKLQEPEKARALLAQATAALDPESWTSLIAQFLRGEVPAQSFLDRANGPGQRTEAHAYIGLVAAIDGRGDEARRHLQWVRDRGRPTYVEYEMSLAELRRLGSVPLDSDF